MRKVLLIHISSHCNPLATMLNNGNFGFPYSLFPRFPPLQSGAAFSTPAFSVAPLETRHMLAPEVSWSSGASVRTPTDWTDWNERRFCRSVPVHVFGMEQRRRRSRRFAEQCRTHGRTEIALSLGFCRERSTSCTAGSLRLCHRCLTLTSSQFPGAR